MRNNGIIDRLKNVDPILFASSLVLSLISIITIYGAMDNFGRSKLIMQSAMLLIGTLVLFFVANIDYRFFIDRFGMIMLIISAALLAITLIFGTTGENIETANRSWLRIPGINIAIQPSEFVKVTFLCTFSKHLDLVKKRLNSPKYLLGVLLHAAVIVGLILMSGDLGVSLVYIFTILAMLYFAGLSPWYFLGGGAAVAALAPLLWMLLREDQKNRIIFGFMPELDASGVGMQALMSRDAIVSGGFFGKGLFGGYIYEILPASHTDFILSTICEKFGFFGASLVVIALAVMVVRLVVIAMRTRDYAGRLICGGIATIIMVQTLESIWMCIAVVPVVGITLPFVSAGGSSLLALYMLMGLAHSVYANERKYNFKKRKRDI